MRPKALGGAGKGGGGSVFVAATGQGVGHTCEPAGDTGLARGLLASRQDQILPPCLQPVAPGLVPDQHHRTGALADLVSPQA